MPEEQQKTGEEDEHVLYAAEGTLFQFDDQDSKTWRERGRGELRVNKAHSGNSACTHTCRSFVVRQLLACFSRHSPCTQRVSRSVASLSTRGSGLSDSLTEDVCTVHLIESPASDAFIKHAINVKCIESNRCKVRFEGKVHVDSPWQLASTTPLCRRSPHEPASSCGPQRCGSICHNWPYPVLYLFRSGKAGDATARELQAAAQCKFVAAHACQHDGWQQGKACS